MAILDDLIMKVEDPVLRDRLETEVRKITKQKKFGLVFEEHLPECTPLYDIPVRKCGSNQVTTGQRGYTLRSGIFGSNKTVNRCGNCGHMWDPK